MNIEKIQNKLKTYSKKLLDSTELKKFFMGFFLMPWIVVWGWLLVLIIICVWFLSNNIYINKDPSLNLALQSTLSFPTTLALSSFSILGFYSIANFISAKFRWVRLIVLIMSFYALILVSIQSYPYFVVLLTTSL